MKEITLEQIRKYNTMVEAAIGTGAYDMLGLIREYRDEDTKKWGGNPYGYLYPIATYDWANDDDSFVKFFLKNVNGRSYIYTYLDGDLVDRHLLEGKEIAKAFFGV